LSEFYLSSLYQMNERRWCGVLYGVWAVNQIK
jgi:hypothetical protein